MKKRLLNLNTTNNNRNGEGTENEDDDDEKTMHCMHNSANKILNTNSYARNACRLFLLFLCVYPSGSVCMMSWGDSEKKIMKRTRRIKNIFCGTRSTQCVDWFFFVFIVDTVCVSG